MRKVKILVCGLIFTLLQGCIGFEAVYPKEETTLIGNASIGNTIEKKYVREQDGYLWSGVILSIGFPIPLVVPVGKEEFYEIYKGDKLVGHKINTTRGNGFICWLFVICERKPGMSRMFFHGE